MKVFHNWTKEYNNSSPKINKIVILIQVFVLIGYSRVLEKGSYTNQDWSCIFFYSAAVSSRIFGFFAVCSSDRIFLLPRGKNVFFILLFAIFLLGIFPPWIGVKLNLRCSFSFLKFYVLQSNLTFCFRCNFSVRLIGIASYFCFLFPA